MNTQRIPSTGNLSAKLVAGVWHGSCRSEASGLPAAGETFTASFRCIPFGECNLYGELDDIANTNLAPRPLIGSQSGFLIRFAHPPARPAAATGEPDESLEFAGYLSNDGTAMRGCWRRVGSRQSDGTWTAFRADPVKTNS